MTTLDAAGDANRRHREDGPPAGTAERRRLHDKSLPQVPTPRTDAEAFSANTGKDSALVVEANFARQLERELADAHQDVLNANRVRDAALLETSKLGKMVAPPSSTQPPDLMELAATWCEAAGKYDPGMARVWANRAKMLRECYRPQVVSAPSATLTPPTEDEIAAYRDLFRAELDKNMAVTSRCASPSTDAHAVALRRFVENRNRAQRPERKPT